MGKANKEGTKYPYCSINDKRTKCTYDRKSIGRCMVVGGCPMVKGWVHCSDIRQQPSNNYALQEYGEGSRCFEMDPNIKWKISKTETSRYSLYGATHACYRYNCDDGTLNIIVHDQALKCERAGMRIDVEVTKDGSIHTGKIYHESRLFLHQ